MNKSELLDIVSNSDTVIGILERDQVYAQKLNSFRVINAFIINNAGQIWIPRRHADKKLFPLHLDASVGGHVMSGESYEDAFIRETEEEVGIVIGKNEIEVLGRLTPHQHGVSAFMYVYKINSDVVPKYNQNDFVESYWFSPQEVLEKLRNGDKAKGDLPILIRELF